MIDTHCHLYVDNFDNDRPAMVARAKAAGVERCYLPAIDSSVTAALLKMEVDYPGFCLAMMGLHPCSVNNSYKTELDSAAALLGQRTFAGIGETGLDFYWDKTFVAQQFDAFRTQAQWAKQFDIPLVIHSRQSTPECIKVVREAQDGSLKGVFHCFGGSLEEARQIINLGFYLGIGGVITYKNAGLAEVIAQLPLDNIVLETDAPYLTPVPFRGKRNESSYLTYIVQKIAGLKDLSPDEIVRQTNANANRLFGWAENG